MKRIKLIIGRKNLASKANKIMMKLEEEEKK